MKKTLLARIGFPLASGRDCLLQSLHPFANVLVSDFKSKKMGNALSDCFPIFLKIEKTSENANILQEN